MITKQHVLEILTSATVHSTLAIGLEHLIHAFVGGCSWGGQYMNKAGWRGNMQEAHTCGVQWFYL